MVPRKRAVYVATVDDRTVIRERPPRNGWDLTGLLDLATSKKSPVLIGVDVAIGLPDEYLRLLENQKGQHFVRWLFRQEPEFFNDPPLETPRPESWLSQPFFRVVSVDSGGRALNGFLTDIAERHGVKDSRRLVFREIDQEAGAQSLFVVSGIPGTVGHGTRSFWGELRNCCPRPSDRDFSVWPFEAAHPGAGTILAETYPALAYAAALEPCLSRSPKRVLLTKTGKENDLRRVCALLESSDSWPGSEARFNVDRSWCAPSTEQCGCCPRCNEDEFDAFITAAAVLRCLVSGQELCDRRWVKSKTEGSMLLAGPVDPTKPARTFQTFLKSLKRDHPHLGRYLKSVRQR